MSEQEPLNEFDQALKKAMQRVNAPETLSNFLMAATEVQQERNLPRRDRKHGWAWSFMKPRPWFGPAGFAFAALLLVGVVTGERAHERHERAAVATEQFETATRITDQALQHTREQLAKAGVSLEQ